MTAAALVGPTASSAFATSITPTAHDGNITATGTDAADCGNGFAIDIDGSKTSGSSGGVTINLVYHNSNTSVDWSAVGGTVSIAFVKGGDAYNQYNYGSPATSDTGLVSPLNGGQQLPNISHTVFCVSKTETTTTESTTTTKSTTTTVPTTTSSGTESSASSETTDTSTTETLTTKTVTDTTTSGTESSASSESSDTSSSGSESSESSESSDTSSSGSESSVSSETTQTLTFTTATETTATGTESSESSESSDTTETSGTESGESSETTTTDTTTTATGTESGVTSTSDGTGSESGAEGGVLGTTGSPRATPPATDAASVSHQPGSPDGFRFVLLGLAALLALILLLQPRPVTVREE